MECRICKTKEAARWYDIKTGSPACNKCRARQDHLRRVKKKTKCTVCNIEKYGRFFSMKTSPRCSSCEDRRRREEDPDGMRNIQRRYNSSMKGRCRIRMGIEQREHAYKLANNPEISKQHDSIYKKCKELGDDYEVDHIIPLKHELVCGLHVPWNLQILNKQDNRSKRNKFDGTYNNDSWREL